MKTTKEVQLIINGYQFQSLKLTYSMGTPRLKSNTLKLFFWKSNGNLKITPLCENIIMN
jgi:hypothetical protein